MVSPLLYNKQAFDSTEITEFIFNYSGNQSIKNRLRIFNNVDSTQVYDGTQTTFQLKHTLPANTLINGNTYWCEVYTIDINEVQSPASNKIIFKTFTKPTWSFSNLISDQIIRNSSYQVQLTYSQPEGELLNSYQVSLYNSGQSLLHQSGIFI